MKNYRFLLIIVLAAAFVFLPRHFAWAQATSAERQPSASSTGNSSQPSSAQALPRGSNEAAGRTEAAAQEERAKKDEAEEDQTAQFKRSPSVKWLARKTGLSLEGAYWLSFIINFLVVVVLIGLGLKSNVPAMLRSRTQDVQRAIEEARRASEDAGRRLSAVEERLSKLNVSISELQAQAEAESRAEEQRLWAAAEEEKRKIVQSAEQEIAAAANAARRELKLFAVELAMANAEKQVRVDPIQDKQLVRDFVEQLEEQATRNGSKA
jgi:F-type H+-transporting ATPase subunit b